MLVLTRKNEESVVVGGSEGFAPMLKVTVLGIGSGKVRLGFEVDGGISVHRLEVWERISSHSRMNQPATFPTVPNEDSQRWEDGGARHRATGVPWR